MPAIAPLKSTSKASCSACESEYFGSIMLSQLLIFHTAGGKPALFEGCSGKGQLLCNILQHRKVGVVHRPRWVSSPEHPHRYFKQIHKALVQSLPPSYGKSRQAINCIGRWLLGSVWDLATASLCRWSCLDGPESERKKKRKKEHFLHFLCYMVRKAFPVWLQKTIQK